MLFLLSLLASFLPGFALEIGEDWFELPRTFSVYSGSHEIITARVRNQSQFLSSKFDPTSLMISIFTLQFENSDLNIQKPRKFVPGKYFEP